MGLIIVPHGLKIKLSRKLGVSVVTVWAALADRSRSKLAQKIRKAALQSGGHEMA